MNVLEVVPHEHEFTFKPVTTVRETFVISQLA